MLAHGEIIKQEDALKYFIFPLGVMSFPKCGQPRPCHETMRRVMMESIRRYFFDPDDLTQEGCPVVVYEMLHKREGWNQSKPPPELVTSYVDSIVAAVGILNAAGIAHMDLRPSNIMWRRNGESILREVEVKIIDLEDAVPFGYYISFVEVLKSDSRYPVADTDDREHIPASSLHNDWFCEVISSWARQEEQESFAD